MELLQHNFGDDASYFHNQIRNFILESNLPKEIEIFEKSVGCSIKDFYENKINFKEIKNIDALFKRNVKALFAKSKMDIHNSIFKTLFDYRADHMIQEVVEYAKAAKKRIQETSRAKIYLTNGIMFGFAENGRFSAEENIESLCDLSLRTMVSGKQFVGKDGWIPHTTSLDSLIRQFSSSGLAVVWHQKISVLMDFLNQPEAFLEKGLIKRPDFLLSSAYYKKRLAIITTNIEDKYEGKFYEFQRISENEKLKIRECIDSYVYSLMDERLLHSINALEIKFTGLYWQENDVRTNFNELKAHLNSTSSHTLRFLSDTNISLTELKDRLVIFLYNTFLSGEGFVNERMILKGDSPNIIIHNLIGSQILSIGLRMQLEALKIKLDKWNLEKEQTLTNNTITNKREKSYTAKHYALYYLFELDMTGRQLPLSDGGYAQSEIDEYGLSCFNKKSFTKTIREVLKYDRNSLKDLKGISQNWREIVLELSQDPLRMENYLKTKNL